MTLPPQPSFNDQAPLRYSGHVPLQALQFQHAVNHRFRRILGRVLRLLILALAALPGHQRTPRRVLARTPHPDLTQQRNVESGT